MTDGVCDPASMSVVAVIVMVATAEGASLE